MLSAPLLDLVGVPLSLATISRLSALMAGLGLGRVSLGGRTKQSPVFAGNPLTSDPQRFQRNAELFETHPQLAVGGPTVAWVRGACRAIATVQEPSFVASIRIPTLFVAAGGDRIVSTPAIERCAPRRRAGA